VVAMKGREIKLALARLVLAIDSGDQANVADTLREMAAELDPDSVAAYMIARRHEILPVVPAAKMLVGKALG
jgi:hypothetical protein